MEFHDYILLTNVLNFNGSGTSMSSNLISAYIKTTLSG